MKKNTLEVLRETGEGNTSYFGQLKLISVLIILLSISENSEYYYRIKVVISSNMFDWTILPDICALTS